jgi:hypothetical protein
VLGDLKAEDRRRAAVLGVEVSYAGCSDAFEDTEAGQLGSDLKDLEYCGKDVPFILHSLGSLWRLLGTQVSGSQQGPGATGGAEAGSTLVESLMEGLQC